MTPPPTPAVPCDPVIRAAALSGIAGPLLYALIVAVLGYLTPGYDHATQQISELGAVGAPYAAVMNILGTGVFGLSAIVFAAGLRRALGGGYAASAIALFVGIAGAAGIAEGVFPCDPGCVPVTLPGTLHLAIGIVPLIAMLIAMEAFALTTRARAEWRGFFLASQTAVAATILFTVAVSSGTRYIGLFQRLLIGTILLWVVLVAVRMYRGCAASA